MSLAKWASPYTPREVLTSAQALAELVENKPLLAGVESPAHVLARWVREHRRHAARLAEVLPAQPPRGRGNLSTWEAVNEGGRNWRSLSYSSLLRGGEVSFLLWKHEKCRMLSPNNDLRLLPGMGTKCHRMNFGAGNGNAELGTA